MDKTTKNFGAAAAAALAASAVLLAAGCGGGGGGGSSPAAPSVTTSSTTEQPPAPPALPTSPVATPVVDQTPTLSNLRSVGLALAQYVQDYDETLPVAQSVQAVKPLLMPYAHDSTVFVDPNTSTPFAWNASLSGTTLTQTADYSTIVTFYVAAPALTDARPLVLLNGHAELVTDAQWQTLKSSSHIP